MRQSPFRPNNEISQAFTSGIVKIYRVQDAAEPGYQPKPSLTRTVTLRYEEQRAGLTRYYAARQNNVTVERVVRVPKGPAFSPQDVAVTEDGRQYVIDMVQIVQGVWPACLDVTLARTDQVYQLPEETEGGEA